MQDRFKVLIKDTRMKICDMRCTAKVRAFMTFSISRPRIHTALHPILTQKSLNFSSL